MLDSKSIAQKCVQIAEDKKADDIIALHVEKQFMVADYFVICNGNTSRHAEGIAQEMEKELKQHDVRCHHREYDEEGKWYLIDFDSVIVHIFQEDSRSFYELEDLWSDAKQVNLSDTQTKLENEG